MPELGRINVFYSYAHKDETYRTRLVECLGALRDEGVISDWHDRKIVAGTDWGREIARHLDRAHVVLFLISPAFMRSEYSMGVEVRRALALHWERRCRIVPIVLQPTPAWTDTEFGTFQALPRDAKPVSQWPRKEAAYADIAEGLRKVCKEIVDWENPFRRATVGDWTEYEQDYLIAGQRLSAQVHTELIAKDRHTATLHVAGSGGGREVEQNVRVPLDEPLEDNMQNLLGQFKERIPANASFSREETGRGEEKIFVGGTPYYCSWHGIRIRYDTLEGRAIFDGKKWLCIDVPLDGIVKSEGMLGTEAGQILSQCVTVLTGFGHGTGRPARARKARPPAPVASRLSPTLPAAGFAGAPGMALQADGQATLALILGLVALFFPVVAPIALFQGISANRKRRQSGLPSSGAAWTGIVLGSLMTLGLVVAVVVIIGALVSF